MPIYKITFSPTGGTQKIADLFTDAFAKESIAVDLTDRTLPFHDLCFTSDDICIVSIPSYGGRVPELAVSRLQQLSGESAMAVLIAVYGNRAYEDTLLELQDTLIEAGFRCAAAIAAVAEHSIMRQFATGRPDQEDAAELVSFAEKVRQKIENHSITFSPILRGDNPFRKYGGVPLKPKAGKSCTKCGLCAEKCPAGAIPADNPAATDRAACISCMRCLSICPNNARSLNHLVLTVAAQKMKKACSGRKKNELFL